MSSVAYFSYTKYFVIFAFNATKTAGGHTDDSTGLGRRKRNVISNHYHLDESIFNFRVAVWDFLKIVLFEF